MRPEQKSKSRQKLWNSIEGAKVITGVAGYPANWTIVFPNLAAVGDTVTIGPYVWEFVAEGGEDTALDSVGTAADPHLISIGTATPDATKAAANLATSLIAETLTSGAWGFLHPVNATGVDATTGTVTINFWPGTFANAATYITVTATGTDPTVANVSDGTQAKSLLSDYSVNLIDAALHANDKEYYHMVDGQTEGQICKVAVKVATGDATPTIIGKLVDTATASVEALFATAEPGMYASFMWVAGAWYLQEEGFGTALTFDAAT
jgi:hypothetical protein